jgi:hypothetical protein
MSASLEVWRKYLYTIFLAAAGWMRQLRIYGLILGVRRPR